MLWVLKRTVPIRRFFWAPKTYVQTDGLENSYNFTLKNCVYLNLWICYQTRTYGGFTSQWNTLFVIPKQNAVSDHYRPVSKTLWYAYWDRRCFHTNPCVCFLSLLSCQYAVSLSFPVRPQSQDTLSSLCSCMTFSIFTKDTEFSSAGGKTFSTFPPFVQFFTDILNYLTVFVSAYLSVYQAFISLFNYLYNI